jgi:hypothetical protein
MIHHVLLLKWRADASPAQIGEAMARTESLRALPCIAGLRSGIALGLVADSYDFVVLMDFATRADWSAYQGDPLHAEHAAFVRGLVTAFARVQYEDA